MWSKLRVLAHASASVISTSRFPRRREGNASSDMSRWLDVSSFLDPEAEASVLLNSNCSPFFSPDVATASTSSGASLALGKESHPNSLGNFSSQRYQIKKTGKKTMITTSQASI